MFKMSDVVNLLTIDCDEVYLTFKPDDALFGDRVNLADYRLYFDTFEGVVFERTTYDEIAKVYPAFGEAKDAVAKFIFEVGIKRIRPSDKDCLDIIIDYADYKTLENALYHIEDVYREFWNKVDEGEIEF